LIITLIHFNKFPIEIETVLIEYSQLPNAKQRYVKIVQRKVCEEMRPQYYKFLQILQASSRNVTGFIISNYYIYKVSFIPKDYSLSKIKGSLARFLNQRSEMKGFIEHGI
jgi:hypothetical protein